MAGLADVPTVVEVDHVTSESNGFTRHRFYFGRVVSSGFEQAADTGIDIVPAPAQPSANTASTSGRDWEPHNLRAWRIALGIGAHLAVETMPLFERERQTFDAQKQIALAWAIWVFTNGRELPTLHNEQPAMSADSYTDPGSETPRNYMDEEIPF
jgi:hypothetical protein